MKIRVDREIDIPDCLEPHRCRRFNAPKGEIECCQFISFYPTLWCILFDDSIQGFRKCPACVAAHQEVKK